MSRRKHRQGALRRLRKAVRDEEPAQPSPLPKSFLDLPPELRDEAYKLLLVAPGKLYLGQKGYQRHCNICYGTNAEKQFRKVCRINRQIRSEAREIFFKYNTFQMSVCDDSVSRLLPAKDVWFYRYNVEEVRKFELTRSTDWVGTAVISIDLTRRTTNTSVDVCWFSESTNFAQLVDWRDWFEQEVANVVSSRSRKECLTEGDLGSILDLMALYDLDYGSSGSSR